jgi:SAM-dependent methyltransferase
VAASAGGPSERQEDDQTSPWWGEHVSRYEWAGQYVGGRQVLDAACGSGFGVRILAAAGATRVIGVDIDWTSLSDVRINNSSGCGRGLVATIASLPFPDGQFDVITSFETIEHVEDVPGCLREFRRVLKHEGVLICSTPNRKVNSPDGIIRNPFHLREFEPAELGDALRSAFGDVLILGQHCRRTVGAARSSKLVWSTLTQRGVRKLPWRLRETVSQALTTRPLFPSSEEFAFTEDYERAPTLFAICAPSRLPGTRSS